MLKRDESLSSQDIADALFQERKKERQRIARILHDEFLQQCQAVVLALETAPATPGALAALARQTRDAIVIGRNLILELRPTAASPALGARINLLGMDLCERAGIRFDVALPAPLATRTDAFADELFMCIAEAIRNAVRHAQATRIRVAATRAATGIAVSVTDDGKGMPGAVMQDPEAERYFGLTGMRERVAGLGGVMQITGGAAAGTAIVFRFGAAGTARLIDTAAPN